MATKKIMVVEDDKISAMLVQSILERLGYEIFAIESSGEAALEKLKEELPDLILMDIVLQGKMDGVETSERIHESYDIPIIYLTGLTGDNILKRAKITEPYGYILKPFQERELHTIIEIALYRHNLEKRMRENEGKLEAMLQSIGDHMCMMDKDMKIIWANDVTKNTFGEDVVGKLYCDVFLNVKKDCNADSFISIESFKDKKIHNFEKEVKDPSGNEMFFTCTANVALKDKEGNPQTILEVARDITAKIKLERKLQHRFEETKRFNSLMVGRELKMVELKKEIAQLKSEKKDLIERIEKLETK